MLPTFSSLLLSVPGSFVVLWILVETAFHMSCLDSRLLSTCPVWIPDCFPHVLSGFQTTFHMSCLDSRLLSTCPVLIPDYFPHVLAGFQTTFHMFCLDSRLLSTCLSGFQTAFCLLSFRFEATSSVATGIPDCFFCSVNSRQHPPPLPLLCEFQTALLLLLLLSFGFQTVSSEALPGGFKTAFPLLCGSQTAFVLLLSCIFHTDLPPPPPTSLPSDSRLLCCCYCFSFQWSVNFVLSCDSVLLLLLPCGFQTIRNCLVVRCRLSQVAGSVHRRRRGRGGGERSIILSIVCGR